MTIAICSMCKGYGGEPDTPHPMDYDPEDNSPPRWNKCRFCNGTGRVTVHTQPFEPHPLSIPKTT